MVVPISRRGVKSAVAKKEQLPEMGYFFGNGKKKSMDLYIHTSSYTFNHSLGGVEKIESKEKKPERRWVLEVKVGCGWFFLLLFYVVL